MIKCPICLTQKKANQYGIDRSRHDGRSLYCKPCVNEKMAHHRQRLNKYKAHQRALKRRQAAANAAVMALAAQEPPKTIRDSSLDFHTVALRAWAMFSDRFLPRCGNKFAVPN